MTSQKPLRRAERVILVFGVAIVTLVAVFVIGWSITSGPGYGVQRRTFGPDLPIPDYFRYLMFPKGRATLHGAPGGAPTGELARAVANEKSEIEKGGWTRVNASPSDAWVQMDELAFLPSTGDPAALVTAWREWCLSKESSYSQASAEFSPGSQAGWTRVRFRMTPTTSDPENGYAWLEYGYETDGRRVQAEELRIYNPKGAAFVLGGLLLVAVFAALVTGGTVSLLIRPRSGRTPRDS